MSLTRVQHVRALSASKHQGYIVLLVLALISMMTSAGTAGAATGPCGTGSNPIVCENSQPGTPMADWYSPNAWGDIEGFPTVTSVTPGGTVNFKISSPSVSYTIEIYRLGWYGGDGARLMPTSPTTVFPKATQPACDKSASTGMTDCGNWSVTASWAVPSTAVSGVYIAAFDQTDGAGYMPYPFVVNDPTSHSNVVVQTSDEAWQAYNMYGGADLYLGNGPAPDGRDYSVSYNRPMDISGNNGVFGSEYAMIEWLERNGYDVSYLSGIDVATSPSLLLNHKVFVSSGHDEYWNQQQWNAVTAAKKAGVNLAFFAGNDVFWRTQLQPSIADGTANRTIDEYKMTKMEFNPPDGIADPSGQWTGTWMDPAGAGIGGNSDQNQLTGTQFTVNGYREDAITISYPYSQDRFWRNTKVAALTAGQSYTTQPGTLGYEWDSDVNNAVRPPGEIDLSSTSVAISDGTLLQDYGNTYGNGTAVHNMTLYRDPTSHALVFSSGTVQWSWGLSAVHSDVNNVVTTEDPVIQQATANLLADMGVQPLTIQSNLVAPTGSSNTTAPVVTVATPAAGTTVPAMQPLTISGTATSAAGVVARVEVSTDGGTTWQPATGLSTWSYSWTPTAIGSATIQVRAEDDSVNVSSPVSVNLTVGPEKCPCSVFPTAAVPGTVNSGDGSSVNLGLRFSTTVAGEITGLRFYKSTANTGTHVGSLWSSTGSLMGSVTFTNETASGWQTANFASPIPVRANTQYIVSYLAPVGHYSVDGGAFATQGAGLAPITAPASTSTAPNGLYAYSSASTFPSQVSNNSNYWVDPVFLDQTSSVPPTVTATTPASAATAVPSDNAITATFSEGIDPTTLTFTLKDQNGTAANGTVTYDQTGHVATFTPYGELNLSDTYTATVSATDLWGNVIAAPYSWSFTTASTPPTFSCPCSLWHGTATPATTSASDTNSVELGTEFQSASAGYITGLSFYKGTGNTGTHVGSLWSSTGTLLASGTFTGETTTGWQSLTFTSPVAITANTPYVVSYLAPNGHYAANSSYFTGSVTTYPLTALASGVTTYGNGLYAYSSSAVFPTNSYNATNYWVDPTFALTAPTGSAAVAGNTAEKPSTQTTTNPGVVDAVHPISVAFGSAIQPQSLKITVSTTLAAQGSESSAGAKVSGTVSYDATTRTALFRPSVQLLPGETYRAVATATGVDGKAQTKSWTFRTVTLSKAPTKVGQGKTPMGGRISPPVSRLAEETGPRHALVLED